MTKVCVLTLSQTSSLKPFFVALNNKEKSELSLKLLLIFPCVLEENMVNVGYSLVPKFRNCKTVTAPGHYCSCDQFV